MKKVFNIVFLTALILGGCNTGNDERAKDSLQTANGDRFYGGIFRMNESSYVGTFYPPKIVSSVSQRVTSQVYEGLVKFNQKNLGILPALAEKWEIDSSGTVYTFSLRSGITFHDDECFENGQGRTLTAQDIKWCFENLALNTDGNPGYEKILKDKVVGATEFHDGNGSGEAPGDIEGITVINDQTLQINLLKPYSNFLFLLSMPASYIYPKEAFEMYGEDLKVGTGPFRVSKLEENVMLFLERNPNYYGYDQFNNQLPFLDGIKITFIAEMDSVVEEFKRGNYDMIYALPTNYIIDILEYGTTNSINYVVQDTVEMLVQYFEFLTVEGIFTDINLRKAFNYAIDREMIKNKILQGEVEAGINGITPNVFEGYDVSQIEGYTLDVKKARQLLAKAGFPDGKGFPDISIDINEGVAGINVKVAEEIKAQLKKNLNIDVGINVMVFNEKVERSRKGELLLWRSGWRSDYPHPESFLSIFYGRDVPEDLSKESFPNTSRYTNQRFDELYEKGLRAKSVQESYNYFMEAEQVAMNDAPAILLYYSENYRLLQPYVSNFPNNAMQYRDFSEVFIKFSEMDKGLEQAKR